MELSSYSKNSPLLIAPCGMNCGVCIAHLREKNKCPGCRAANDKKPITRVRCKIKTCEVLRNGRSTFCFQCTSFPCGHLKHLDRRYRTTYGMSMIDNLESIRNHGIRDFVENEKERWACARCGGAICVHNRLCADCGKKQKK